MLVKQTKEKQSMENFTAQLYNASNVSFRVQKTLNFGKCLS